MSKPAAYAETLIAVLLSVVGIAFTLLHFLGGLESEKIDPHIPALTLGCVAIIMTSLVLQQRAKIDNLKQALATFSQQQKAQMDGMEKKLAESTEKVIRSLDGVEVTMFPQPKDLYRYVVRRMGEAQHTIDDLTWGLSGRERTPEVQEAYEEYVRTIKAVCSRGAVAYREVMSFPAANHFDRADAMLRQGKSSYRLRYYEVSNEHSPPLISFMVIDSQEVIFAFYRAGLLPAEREIRVAVKHPDIANLFTDYYDAIWQGARPLDGGQEGRLSMLQEVRKRLSQNLRQ